MNKINKAACRLSKFLKGNIEYESLCKYITQFGFDVVIADINDDIIKRFGLCKELKKRKSFVYCSSARFIFIRRTESPETYVHLLLHEIGHIVLDHIDEAYMECHNNFALEAEVSQFVEKVHFQCAIIKNVPKVIVCIIAAAILIISVGIITNTIKNYQNDVLKLERELINKDGAFVYVPPSGERYHRATCAYANNGIKVEKEEAVKLYTPCKICNP